MKHMHIPVLPWDTTGLTRTGARHSDWSRDFKSSIEYASKREKYTSTQLQRELHTNTFKVTVVSVHTKPKQNTTRMSIVITLHVSLTSDQTITFITNMAGTSCDYSLLNSSAPNSGCRLVHIILLKFRANPSYRNQCTQLLSHFWKQ
jgi:hypothetical protein